MRIVFLVCLLAIANIPVHAQPEIDADAIKLRYSKYNAVVTSQVSEYVFDVVKDTLQVKQDFRREIFIINDHLKAFTKDFIYYGNFSSVEDIMACTWLPEGKNYRKIPVTLFNESNDRDRQVFFDDSKTISFAYPSITEGAVTSLKYTVVYQNPRFLNKCYFQSFIPVIESKVIVKVHKDIRIGYRIFNDKDIMLNARQYSKGNYNYYVWEAHNVAPSKYLSSGFFSVTHFSPHIALFVEEINSGGKTQKYYSTTSELHRFYSDLVSRMDTTASPELRALVADITQGLSDRDKAKAIYYWVQNNIKYVAYSDGYMGFIPVPPSEVFSKRFGDCKGMAGLINKMMELAGLQSCLAWVGTRHIPYTYGEMPLPGADNHMVTAYIKGDSTLIMDGTFTWLDFGVYPYHIQGKEVLISLDKDKYRIFKVPVSPAGSNSVYDSVSVELSGQKIIGAGRRIHRGFNKVELATAMAGVKETDYMKRFSVLFAKGNNKFRVDSAKIINLFAHDRQAEVTYDFTLEDYAKALDDEIFINLNLNKTFHNAKIDTAGQYSPVINDFCFTEKHITRLTIPEGYKIEYIPENDTIVTSDIKISFRYTTGDNYVILEKEMIFAFLMLKDEKIAEWNTMIDRLNNNYRLSLVLKKIHKN